MGAGRLDGIVSTIDTMIPHLKTGKEFQYVLALDDSAGGDGIVARKEIKSVRDLRGKRVAVQEGSVSQFFLNVLLRDAGLSEKDVRIVNMKPGDAGAAFVAGRVDAAVTWEPWLSNGQDGAARAPARRLVPDSRADHRRADLPAGRHREAAEGDPGRGGCLEQGRGLLGEESGRVERRSWPGRSGDWLKDPKLFADVLTGVRFYDREANVKFFGTPQKPGALYNVVQNALDVTGGLGALQVKVAPRDLVNHSFVK